jgi:hypothetical protein
MTHEPTANSQTRGFTVYMSSMLAGREFHVGRISTAHGGTASGTAGAAAKHQN